MSLSCSWTWSADATNGTNNKLAAIVATMINLERIGNLS
jgi:hypothetical protein